MTEATDFTNEGAEETEQERRFDGRRASLRDAAEPLFSVRPLFSPLLRL